METSTALEVIAGIDEAGRGPLAGPVVACACVLPERKKIPVFIGDSKQMTPQQRDESFAWITANCLFGVGSTEAEEIDLIGILAATEKAMQAAVAGLAVSVTPTYLLVDGRDRFWFDYPHSSIVRGDSLEKCIGAASIIAKVTRDRQMREHALKFPQYGFEGHKGYGSAEHIAAIRMHGPCALHRRSFLRNILPAA